MNDQLWMKIFRNFDEDRIVLFEVYTHIKSNSVRRGEMC